MARTFVVRSFLSRRAVEGPLRAIFTPLFVVMIAAGLVAQQQAPAVKAVATPPKASGVDTVIALVKGGMSETMVIRTLKKEGRAYNLATADLLKLQKAGVSEAIIEVMLDPGRDAVPASAAPASAAPAVRATPSAAPVVPAGAVTAFPPDLPDVPAVTKRRLAIKAFDYSAVQTWVQYWFNTNVNIGEGIRSMLGVRLQKSQTVVLLERAKIQDVMNEQDFNASNRVKRGSGAKIGQITGADAMLYGDIVIFGRDDTTKNKTAGAILGHFLPAAGAIATMNRSEKAVVGINLRLVDAETSETIEAEEARGESSRSSKDYGGILGIKGAAVGAASSMTSSNFEQTIIGEATSNAVAKIVEYLERRLPQMPARARSVEGRLAQVSSGSAILAIGTDDGVTRGDRFEILRINGEIKDPTTKEVIDVDAVKVGELVVDTVRDRTASGQYGGQPLSAAYATNDKGYLARLMVRR